MACNLPTEVLEKVLSYLKDPKDVVHARLTHRAFAKAGLRSLTSTVYLSKYYYDLDRLMEVSWHPEVASTIETLVCDDRSFICRVQAVSVEENAAGEETAVEIDGGPPHRDELKRNNVVRLEWYFKMCRQERQMRDDGRQMAVLSATLPDLPNLNEVIITDCCGRLSEGGRSQVTRGRIYQTLYHRKNQNTADTPAPQLWELTQVQPLSDPWDALSTPYHGLVNLIRALSINNKTIRSLSIKGRVIGLSPKIFAMSTQDFSYISNVFANLTTLELTIDNHALRPGQEDNMRNGRMANVLAAAPLLKSLELAFIGIDDDEMTIELATSGRKFHVASGLGTFTWPELRHFGLINCTFRTYGALASFLGRHKASIRSLKLDMIWFESESVVDFLASCASERSGLTTTVGRSI